jgi:hypothetical protein
LATDTPVGSALNMSSSRQSNPRDSI